MHVRNAAAALVVIGSLLPGCSLPRGPVNLEPLVPRWLAHGEVTCECPPEPLPYDDAQVDPAGIQPPISKFHPLPTRPVFEPFTAAPTAVEPRLLEARR
jgi:hypothetical protein